MMKKHPLFLVKSTIALCLIFFGLVLAVPAQAEVKNCTDACLQADSENQAACVTKCEEFVAKVSETPVEGAACYFNVVFSCSETALIKLPIDVIIDCVAGLINGEMPGKCLVDGFCDAGTACKNSICDCYAKGNTKKCEKNWAKTCGN